MSAQNSAWMPTLDYAGVAIAPGLLLASWALGKRLAWILPLLLGLAMASYCFFHVAFPRLLVGCGERHMASIKGINLTAVNAIVLAALYSLWFWQLAAPPSPVPLMRYCLQNISVLTGLALTFHASVRLASSFGVFGYLPLFFHCMMLPLLETQHLPFAFEGAWPQWFDHAAALLSLVASPVVAWSPAVEVTMVTAKLQQPAGICLERLQSLSAFLCLSYMFVISQTTQQYHGVWWDYIGHVFWSFSRASLVVLFAVYWLEARATARRVQGLLSLVGLSFFLIWAPLVDADALDTARRFRIPNIVEAELMGVGALRVEQLCMLLSVALFFTRGISGGSWRRGSEPLAKALCLCGAGLFAAVSVAALLKVCSVPWAPQEGNRAWNVLMLQGGVVYCFATLAPTALLESALREKLEFQQLSVSLAGSQTCVLPK